MVSQSGGPVTSPTFSAEIGGGDEWEFPGHIFCSSLQTNARTDPKEERGRRKEERKLTFKWRTRVEVSPNGPSATVFSYFPRLSPFCRCFYTSTSSGGRSHGFRAGQSLVRPICPRFLVRLAGLRDSSHPPKKPELPPWKQRHRAYKLVWGKLSSRFGCNTIIYLSVSRLVSES